MKSKKKTAGGILSCTKRPQQFHGFVHEFQDTHTGSYYCSQGHVLYGWGRVVIGNGQVRSMQLPHQTDQKNPEVSKKNPRTQKKNQ